MSFQDFQKAPNRLTLRDIGFLILAGIIIVLVLYGMVVANNYLAQFLPGGGEFYLLRTGGRSFLFDHIEPYSGSVSERVQEQIYGRSAVLGEDLYILDIPFHIFMLFFPLALIPDAFITRTIWMTLSEIALAGLLVFGFRLIGRRVPIVFLALISIASFASFYMYSTLLDSSLAALLGLAYAGILISLRAGLDEMAGALIAVCAFQWEIGGLFLLLVAAWVFWERRWRVFASAGMVAFVLLVISLLLYPSWILPFLQAAWASFRTSSGHSTYDILVQLWPRFGSLIAYVLTAFLIVTLGYEWRAARKAHFNRLVWVACLTVAAIPLLGYRIEMDQLLPLTFPVMLIIVISRERWQKLGNGIAVLLLLFFFGLPWLLYTRGALLELSLPVDDLLYLFWPVFAVIGLYWVRWWMIRPPRTWLDSFPNRGSL